MRIMTVMLILALTACNVGRPAENASGEEIYGQLCANCHGGDLDGGIGPPLGPGSTSADLPDEFLETTILRGRGRMPSFSSSLSDSQLDVLVGYIREVQRQ